MTEARKEPLWIRRLNEAPRSLERTVVRLVSPEEAEASVARATPDDLADAAPLGPDRGAARLRRRRLLRALVARVLGRPEGDVVFGRSPAGALTLLAPAGAYVSAAGREGWSALAVAPRPVGVDLEAASPEPPLPIEALPTELRARLLALVPSERAAEFARLWAEREAWAKLTGVTLDSALARRTVPDGELRRIGDWVIAVAGG